MSWTITYRATRDTPLTDDERMAIIRHVVRHNRLPWVDGAFVLYLADGERPDGQVAWGQSSWQSEEAVDLPRFITALTEIRGLLDWSFITTDDAGRLGWRGGKRQRYMVGERKVETTDLEDPTDLSTGWSSAYELAIPQALGLGGALRGAVVSAVAGMSIPMRDMRRGSVQAQLIDALAKAPEPSITMDALVVVLQAVADESAIRRAGKRFTELPDRVQGVLRDLATAQGVTDAVPT